MQKCLCLFFSLLFAAHMVAAQQPNTAINVLHYRLAININDTNNVIQGQAAITLQFTQAATTVSLDLVGPKGDTGMLVTQVWQQQNEAGFTQDAQHLHINTHAKAGDTATFTIQYHGIPADGLIISTNLYGHRTFFGDNWPNRAHNWFPCNDHLFDKASVEWLVTAPEHYQVVANGIKTEETNLPGHRRLTHWEESAELPTKVMVIGAADFAVQYAGSVQNIPIYSWVYPEDRTAGFATYAMAKNILPFYISHVGPYAYKKLANVQSKTIFGGMENASAIFYYEKSVGSSTAEALIAHEIAHQWFGNTATEKNWQHLWLSEGFATYMTHLYHEEKYGTDSFYKRLAEDRKTVIEFSKKRHTPVVDTSCGNNLMQLLNANSYQKGGWVLHMLRRKLGDPAFWQGVRRYYAVYGGHNADTHDLQAIFEQVSHTKLEPFFKQWLYTPGQPDLYIQWQYNNSSKKISLSVEQKQATLFDFPLEVVFPFAGGQLVKALHITGRKTVFTIPCNQQIQKIYVDPQVNLLGEYSVEGLSNVE